MEQQQDMVGDPASRPALPTELVVLGVPSHECHGPQQWPTLVGPLRRPQARTGHSGLQQLQSLPRSLQLMAEATEHWTGPGNWERRPATARQALPEAEGRGWDSSGGQICGSGREQPLGTQNGGEEREFEGGMGLEGWGGGGWSRRRILEWMKGPHAAVMVKANSEGAFTAECQKGGTWVQLTLPASTPSEALLPPS